MSREKAIELLKAVPKQKYYFISFNHKQHGSEWWSHGYHVWRGKSLMEWYKYICGNNESIQIIFAEEISEEEYEKYKDKF